MSKLRYEDKIEIYNKRKQDTLHQQYGITVHNIQYIILLVGMYALRDFFIMIFLMVSEVT